IKNGSGRDSVEAGADGVKPDLESLDRLGCGIGRDLARIILSIGEEDNDATLGTLIIQPIGRGGDGGTDGRAIFHQTGANSFEVLEKPLMIECHRADDIRMTGKGNDPNSVVRSPLNELPGDFTNGIEPGCSVATNGKILGQH